jgi:AbrB family looped-hinge helix DNA binding protein
MEQFMAAVTLSSKYQVVIPPAVREAFSLTPGQKIEVVIYEGRITLVPVGTMKRLRGIAPGIDTRPSRSHH